MNGCKIIWKEERKMDALKQLKLAKNGYCYVNFIYDPGNLFDHLA